MKKFPFEQIVALGVTASVLTLAVGASKVISDPNFKGVVTFGYSYSRGDIGFTVDNRPVPPQAR